MSTCIGSAFEPLRAHVFCDRPCGRGNEYMVGSFKTRTTKKNFALLAVAVMMIFAAVSVTGIFAVAESQPGTTVAVPTDGVTFTGADAKEYKITVKADPEDGGTVTGGGDYTINSNVTLVATPAPGFEFVEWDDGNTDPVRFVMVKGAKTYTATFIDTTIPQPITLTVDEGSITISESIVEELKLDDVSKFDFSMDIIPKPTQNNVPKSATAYDVRLSYDGVPLTSFSDDVTLLFKYTPKSDEGTKFLNVYYVSDNGHYVEDTEGKYKKEDKGVECKVDHLSNFVVSSEKIEAIVATEMKIAVNPSKTEYTTGDKFDPSGLVLEMKYSDDTKVVVEYDKDPTGFSFSPTLYRSLDTTYKFVNITYDGLTEKLNIVVNDPPKDESGMYTLIGIGVAIVLLIALLLFIRDVRRLRQRRKQAGDKAVR